MTKITMINPHSDREKEFLSRLNMCGMQELYCKCVEDPNLRRKLMDSPIYRPFLISAKILDNGAWDILEANDNERFVGRKAA